MLLVFFVSNPEKLNDYEIDALKKLKDHGLDAEHFRYFVPEWLWCTSSSHVNALIHLIVIRHMGVEAAMTELCRCDEAQAFGISQGLTRPEAEKLNRAKIISLLSLKNSGLTAKDLQEFEGSYTDDHTSTLSYLMSEGMKASRALVMLYRLNTTQAKAMANGFTREEVWPLNDIQITALLKFKEYGLTVKFLQGNNSFNSEAHLRALEHLLICKNMDAPIAIAELTDLGACQATAICAGFIKKEVQGLDDNKIIALLTFKDKMLALELLRRCPWFGSEVHRQAFNYLVTSKNMDAVAAIAVLQDTNNLQAQAISLGFTRDQVKILTETQIIALMDHKDNGLTPELLEGCHWFTEKHRTALHHLITRRQMQLTHAMAELCELTATQAIVIARLDEKRENVINLNKCQLEILLACHQYGLTVKHLQERDQFDEDDKFDLKNLLQNGENVEEALNFIDAKRQNKTAEELYQLGITKYNAMEYSEAINFFGQARVKFSMGFWYHANEAIATCYYSQASCYIAQGKYAQARQAAQNSLSLRQKFQKYAVASIAKSQKQLDYATELCSYDRKFELLIWPAIRKHFHIQIQSPLKLKHIPARSHSDEETSDSQSTCQIS